MTIAVAAHPAVLQDFYKLEWGGGHQPVPNGHQIPSRRPARTAPRVGGRGPSARRPEGGGRKRDSTPSVRSGLDWVIFMILALLASQNVKFSITPSQLPAKWES